MIGGASSFSNALFCESMRDAILPSMMSWASSFSKASTGVLNAEDQRHVDGDEG